MPRFLSIFLASLGLAVLLLVEPSVAKTIYTNSTPDPCQITGDVDVYGIGIRLNFYLQWGATFLAILLNLGEDARSIRIGSNIVIIAILTNLFMGLSSNSIIMIEYFIVLGLVLFMIFFNFPAMFEEVENTDMEMGIKLILIAVYTCLNPWLFFKGFGYGLKDGCRAYIWAYQNIDVTSQRWLSFGRIFGCMAIPIGSICGATGLHRLYKGIREGLIQKESKGQEHSKKVKSGILRIILNPTQAFGDEHEDHVRRYMRWFFAFVHLSVGAIFIASIEETILVNGIDLSAAKLTDSGQFIPLLAGIMGLVCVLWSAIKENVGINKRKEEKGIEVMKIHRQRSLDKKRYGKPSDRAWTSGGDASRIHRESIELNDEVHEGIPRRRTAEMEDGRAKPQRTQ